VTYGFRIGQRLVVLIACSRHSVLVDQAAGWPWPDSRAAGVHTSSLPAQLPGTPGQKSGRVGSVQMWPLAAEATESASDTGGPTPRARDRSTQIGGAAGLLVRRLRIPRNRESHVCK